MNNIKEYVIEILNKFNIDSNILNKYDEPHRFYHNWEHIESMLNSAKEYGWLTDDLLLSVVFHDIIYNPKKNDNEELSSKLFEQYVDNVSIKNAILDTKTHKSTSELSKRLCNLDLEVLYGTMDEFIEFENKICKEYQFVDYNIYKEKRIEVLNSLNVASEKVDYVKHRKLNIGIYAGSFNPFHKGHYNILQKGEEIFDKVIIARGINKSKQNEIIDLPYQITNRQIINYDGLLTDTIDTLGHDVTLIRGLRNVTDLQYEQIQYRFLKDLKPDLKMVSLFCDVEFEHISSSSIRMLQTYGKGNKYIL